MWDKCNLLPDGFRGPYELRWHVMNVHATITRKAWIYVTRSPSEHEFLWVVSRAKRESSTRLSTMLWPIFDGYISILKERVPVINVVKSKI